MSIFYSDKDFWKQNGHSNQADVIEQEAMRLIEDFESIHYDLYLAWLRGEENDNGDIACLEQKLSELYWSLDRVSASAEENPLLQKNDVQD